MNPVANNLSRFNYAGLQAGEPLPRVLVIVGSQKLSAVPLNALLEARKLSGTMENPVVVRSGERRVVLSHIEGIQALIDMHRRDADALSNGGTASKT